MQKAVEITGTYEQTLHRSNDSDWTIGVLDDGTKVVGVVGEEVLQPGLEFQFYGKWDEHPRFGKQFKFSQVILARPSTREGVIAYLTKFAPGIGPRIAQRLWDRLGSNAVTTLRTDPMGAAMNCEGLRVDVATEAAKALEAIAEMEATRMDLMGLFKGRGFSGALIDECIKRWGIHAPNRVRHDPYRLMVEGMPGCGFGRCDRLYQDLGLPLGRLKRQLLCVWHIMRSDSSGHTWFPRADVMDAAARLIGGAELKEKKVLRYGLRSRWLAQHGDLLTIREYANQEERIAARLRELMAYDQGLIWPDVDELEGLSPHQRDVLRKALAGPVAILCGGPGTGKCLGYGTPVLMYDGSVKPVELVLPGDLLMGPDSSPRRVLSTSSGFGPLYEVQPIKGDSWVCNDVHILTLMGSRKVIGKIRDVSVRDYLAELETKVPHADSWKLFRTGVDFCLDAEPPIDPYLVGLWLGDGTRGSPQITNASPVIVEYCRAAANALGLTCKVQWISQNNTNSISFSSPDSGAGRAGTNAFRTFLDNHCHTASGKKRIAQSYLTASRKNREELLCGILDTDGELSGANTFIVGVSGDAYRDGLLFLARSLGFAAYARKTNKQYYRDRPEKLHYTITISGNTASLPLKRHVPQPRQQVKNPLVTGFNLRPLGNGHYCGFTLDGDGRFLLGDFTVTHNTTVAGALIRRMVTSQLDSWDIGVCAPTGKAGVRITESIRKALRGTGKEGEIEGTTIHRLLCPMRNGHDGKGWGFNYNRERPLPLLFVACDESSMPDVPLMASLLDACEPGTHVLFLGDPGQLPPVGHGAPLRDMLACEIPAGELTEIHRFGGRIAHVCQDIRHGRPFKPSPYVHLEAGENYLHSECANTSVAVHRLRKLIETMPPSCDRMWDLQVLCTVNEGTPVSRVELNKGLQAIINPNGEPVIRGFRIGDKSICLSNGMYPRAELCPECDSANVRRPSRDEFRDGGGEVNRYCNVCGSAWFEDTSNPKSHFIANGEVGVLRTAGEKELVFEFADPGRVVSASGENLDSFTLAYAITVHKAQGSQAPYIVFMVDDANKARRVGCRELVMTAISRASRLAITIGQMRILQQDCRRAALPQRRTRLQELLPGKVTTDGETTATDAGDGRVDAGEFAAA